MENHSNELKPFTGLIILSLLAGLISVCMMVLELPTRLTLLLAIIFTCFVALFRKHSADQIQTHLVQGVKKSAFVVIVLFVIGCIIGAWIVGGIMPTIIYYGLEILSPSWFLVSGFIICSIVSYFTGSSYACMGTVGIAFMGIGQGLGVSLPIVAGMVLSGAVFGDKMSPFSDTTNLAAAVAGVDIFDHIKSMMYTTIPAWFVSAAIFGVLGMMQSGTALDSDRIQAIQAAINSYFNVNPLLLVIPVLTIVLVIRKVSPILSMACGAILGILAAFVFQQTFDTNTILVSLTKGLSFDFGSPETNKLFANRGGLASMVYPATIAMMALSLGELLNKIGLLAALIKMAEKVVFNTGSLVFFSIASCLMTTLLTASQYLSIVMPGEALQPLYKKRQISRRVLSRCLEDGGTLFSTLVPWAVDAAFVAGTLGVATIEYLPYAFFLLFSPLFSILFSFIGFGIWKASDESAEIGDDSLDIASVI